MRKQNRNPNKSAYELNREYSKGRNILQNIKQTKGLQTSLVSKSNYKPKFIIKQTLQSKIHTYDQQQENHKQNLHQNQQNMHQSHTFTSSPMGSSQVFITNKMVRKSKDYALIKTRRSQKIGATRTHENSQVNFYNADVQEDSYYSRNQDFNASIQKSKYSMKNQANVNYKLLYLQAKKQLQVRTAYFNEAIGLWTQILDQMSHNLQLQEVSDSQKVKYIKKQCNALIQTFDDYE